MKLAPIPDVPQNREMVIRALQKAAVAQDSISGFRATATAGSLRELAALIEHCDSYYPDLGQWHEPMYRVSAISYTDTHSCLGSAASSCVDVAPSDARW